MDLGPSKSSSIGSPKTKVLEIELRRILEREWEMRRNRVGGAWLEWIPLICAGSKMINRKWNIKTLEAKAILEGLKKILDTCIQPWISLEIESDALEVIKALSGETEDLKEMKAITDSIADHASRFAAIEYRHCCRSSNPVVHSVARQTCNLDFVPHQEISLCGEMGTFL